MRNQRLSRGATKTLHYYSGVALNDKEYIPNILLSDILVGRFFCTSGVDATVLVYAAVSTPFATCPFAYDSSTPTLLGLGAFQRFEYH
jgi:hypothetical protein